MELYLKFHFTPKKRRAPPERQVEGQLRSGKESEDAQVKDLLFPLIHSHCTYIIFSITSKTLMDALISTA